MDSEYDLAITTFTEICPRYERLGFENLTEPERVIFCTWQFVCEVNNGGFHQFFVNPSGEFAAEAVAALEKVQMPQAAAHLRRAAAEFPNQAPAKDGGLRCEELRSLPGRVQNDMFSEFTGAFFDSSEDPYLLQANYIANNRNKFIGSSKK